MNYRRLRANSVIIRQQLTKIFLTHVTDSTDWISYALCVYDALYGNLF
jgi:hypothetical protein